MGVTQLQVFFLFWLVGKAAALWDDCLCAVVADSDAGRIYITDLEMGNSTAIPIAAGQIARPVAVKYVSYEKRVYWTDVNETVGTTYLDGTGYKEYPLPQGTQPSGIAIDTASQTIYLSDYYLGAILTIDMQNAQVHILTNSSFLDNPWDIHLDHHNRHIYLTTLGSQPGIYRLDMDGENLVRLVAENITRPSGLAVDIPADQMYWVDAARYTIEKARLDGSERTVMYRQPGFLRIVIHNEALYVTSYSHGQLVKVKKDGSSTAVTLIGPNLYQGPSGLDLVGDMDECASAPCMNGGTCTNQVNGYTCSCVTGFMGPLCQTNIQECSLSPCINGGTCVDAINYYSCWCVPGYTGPHCETEILCPPGTERKDWSCLPCQEDFYKAGTSTSLCSSCPRDQYGDQAKTGGPGATACFFSPAIPWFYPTYGPIAGGTKMIFLISHFIDYEILNITVAGINTGTLAMYNSSTADTLVTRTNSSDNVTTGQLHAVLINKNDNLTESVYSRHNYEYRPNPIISYINRNTTIISGGLSFDVYGEHLNSVAEPVTTVTAVAKNFRRVYKTKCPKVSNSSHMECLFPELSRPSTTSTKDDIVKRAAEEDTSIHFVVGFEMDGVTSYEEFSNVAVYNDPKFESFSEIDNVKKYVYDTPLQIKGKNLNLVLTKRDITVSVGSGSCDVNFLATNHLACIPPREKPGYGITPRGPRLSVMVMVRYGYQRVVIGYLDYGGDGPPLAIIIPGVVVPLLLVIVAVAVLVWYRMRRGRRKEHVREVTAEMNAYVILTAQNATIAAGKVGPPRAPIVLTRKLQRYEIKPACLDILDILGKGQFGSVYLGCLHEGDSSSQVAVKTVNVESETAVTEFLEEASVMAGFSHQNVVKFLAVTLIDGTPHVVLEYMDQGDLKKYVSDKDKRLMLTDVLYFAAQVADGMTYLSGMGYVHRDLAARNCMINSSQRVKIADFGLSRDIYLSDYYQIETKERPLPIRWMALESMEEGRYTSKSDVWSYGVLLWELLTRGGKPYADVGNYELKDYLRLNRRLDKPYSCPDTIYMIMRRCWNESPEMRPSFEDLSGEIQKILDIYKQSQTT